MTFQDAALDIATIPANVTPEIIAYLDRELLARYAHRLEVDPFSRLRLWLREKPLQATTLHRSLPEIRITQGAQNNTVGGQTFV